MSYTDYKSYNISVYFTFKLFVWDNKFGGVQFVFSATYKCNTETEYIQLCNVLTNISNLTKRLTMDEFKFIYMHAF